MCAAALLAAAGIVMLSLMLWAVPVSTGVRATRGSAEPPDPPPPQADNTTSSERLNTDLRSIQPYDAAPLYNSSGSFAYLAPGLTGSGSITFAVNGSPRGA